MSDRNTSEPLRQQQQQLEREGIVVHLGCLSWTPQTYLSWLSLSRRTLGFTSISRSDLQALKRLEKWNWLGDISSLVLGWQSQVQMAKPLLLR